MARLFIALELSEAQKKEINALQEKIKTYLDGIRWVKPEGLHLTLKFLGETEEERIASIKQALDNASSTINSFEIAYGKSGVFPSPKKARVFWVGLTAGLETVSSLAAEIERSMSFCGFAPEKRKFAPHLTIGRARGLLQEDLIRRFLNEERAFKTTSCLIKKVLLFESELTPRGAIYTVRHKALFSSYDN